VSQFDKFLSSATQESGKRHGKLKANDDVPVPDLSDEGLFPGVFVQGGAYQRK
jgi:hypothetical protein